MKKRSQEGFSLIELIIVVTIIGVIAALGVPSLIKGIRAADNGATFATLRSISSSQISYYSQHNRFARLSELDAMRPGQFGTLVSNTIKKGRFVFEMSPMTPTEAELKDGYTIVASGTLGTSEAPFIFRVNQTGEIVQVTP